MASNKISFKTKLLGTFTLVYSLLWTLFLIVLLFNYRASIGQLVETQKKWLNIYTETLLNDLQVGNAYTVEKKLELLVRKDVFSEAKLDFGRNVLIATRDAGHGESYVPGRLVRSFLPENTFKLDVKDPYNSTWGGLTVTIDPVYLYKPVEQWMYKFGLYIVAFYLLFLGVLLLFIESLAAPLKGLTDYFGEYSRHNYDPQDIKQLLERKHDWHILEWDMLYEEFKTAVRNVSRLEGKVKNFERMAMIGQTTAMIAHDIRKPFSAIKVILNSLESFMNDPSALESGKREIERSINNVEKMVTDLMDFGRELRLEREPSSLVSIFEFVLSQLSKSYADAGIEFSYQFLARYKPDVDDQRIARVFANIVGNGIEAIMESGEAGVAGGPRGRIEIHTSEIRLRDRAGVRIVIANDGPAIPADVLPRLFEPFYTAGKRQGTGMGLASAQKIVSLHGGGITARNRSSGPGVEFVVDLPASAELEDQEVIGLPRSTRDVRLPAPCAPSELDVMIQRLKERRREYRILLLEDEALYRAWVKNTINSYPELKSIVAVYDAHSVAEAMKLLESERIDHAIVDIDLGGPQNGFDFIEQARSRDPGIRCLVHSNRHTEADLERAYALGSSGFVRKPLRIEDLINFLGDCGDGEARPESPGATTAPAAQPAPATDAALDAVLIDDDSLVHFTWSTAAKERGKRLKLFLAPGEFLEISSELDRGTPIYIDSNLGNGLKGEHVAREIRDRGFANVYLATGYDPDTFRDMPWLSGVVGKDPPWAN